MARLKRLSLVAGVLLASLAYVWVAAVRALPGVKARKTAARRRGRPPGASGSD